MAHFSHMVLSAVLALLAGPVESPEPDRAEPQTEVLFVDVARESGLDRPTAYLNRRVRNLLESTGSGVSVTDYDGDGDDDIYVPVAQSTEDLLAGRSRRANLLYRNDGDGTFTEVAGPAGVAVRAWSNAAYFADYDNDGDRDLFVVTWGPNLLYRNNGDGTFTDVTKAAGLSGESDAWSSGAAFGDLDRDGDLDLYVVNYCRYDPRPSGTGEVIGMWKGIEIPAGPRGFSGQQDVLYRNNGDGTFTDVSATAGLQTARPLYGLGVVMSDLDDDGDLDIYVANDSVGNFLWKNNGSLRFKEIGAMAAVATNEDAVEQAGMGVDAADYNGDGSVDLFVTNFSHDWNTLYRNRGGIFFLDATFEARLADAFPMLAWGTKFLDVDNDGWLDLFVANGHIYPEVDDHSGLATNFKQLNSLYLNKGDGMFENYTARAGPGLSIVESTRGLAVGDIDRDGALDVVLSNVDAPLNLLLNRGHPQGSWIAFRLRGVDSNRDAIGTRLTVYANGRKQIREVNPYGSYRSQSSHVVHFGLGSATRVDRLQVRWPSGIVEELKGLDAAKFYTITEGRGVTAVTGPAER